MQLLASGYILFNFHIPRGIKPITRHLRFSYLRDLKTELELW